jgi:hypothetical protein
MLATWFYLDLLDGTVFAQGKDCKRHDVGWHMFF